MAFTEELDLEGIDNEKQLEGFETPEPGTYHLCCLAFNPSPDNYDGKKFQFAVLAGTVEGQSGRTFWESFVNPAPSHKDGGMMAKKRLAKLAIALGLIQRSDLGKRVQINWEAAVGRQLVAKVKVRSWEKDGRSGKSAEFDGLNYWSVTDEEVAGVPKDAEALALMGITVGGSGAVSSQPQTTPGAPVDMSAGTSAGIATAGAPAAAADPYAGL